MNHLNEAKKTISEQVYKYLTHMILSMQLKPAERIAEEEIAKRFGCSRAPIREALKKLEHEGIVNIYPNRYAEISNYNDELIEQIGVVRIFHDIMTVKHVMLYACKDDFLKMRTFADQCFEAAKSDDPALRIQKDCEFHLELSRISRNQLLLKFAKELFIRIEFIQASRYDALVSPQEQLKEHYDIIDLLINHEEQKAIELITKHNSAFHKLSDKFPLEFFIG